MTRRPRILIDVDGPLTRGFFVKVCEFLRAEGVSAHPDLIDRWNVFEAFGASDAVERAVRERLCLPGIARDFVPRPGSGPFLARLRTWADVYACTAPLDDSPTWAHDRERWLRDRLGFSADRVISARDKKIVGGDAFIDDRVSHLVDWQAEPAHRAGLAILWVEPHNSTSAWKGPRAETYGHLEEYLEALRPVVL